MRFWILYIFLSCVILSEGRPSRHPRASISTRFFATLENDSVEMRREGSRAAAVELSDEERSDFIPKARSVATQGSLVDNGELSKRNVTFVFLSPRSATLRSANELIEFVHASGRPSGFGSVALRSR